MVEGISKLLEGCQLVNKWKKLLPFLKGSVLGNFTQTCQLSSKP